MKQNFLVWLFDNRALGVIEIDDHTKALAGEADARKKAGKVAREWISVLYVDEESEAVKLKTAVAGDSIYILGHTNVGLTSLWSKSVGGQELKADEIGDRLDWMELPNKALKLKIFSCYSAVSHTGRDSNLAKAVKERLSETHGNVEFFGYTNTVTCYQEASTWNPTPHKWTSSSSFASRASSYRVKV